MIILEIVFALIIIYGLVIMLGATDSNTKNADYLIVLGTGLENNQITPCLQQRCDKAFRYLVTNPSTKAVLSGGYTCDSKVSEASAMKAYLNGLGIKDERLIIEDRSIDTVENITFSFAKINCNYKIVICSNNYHLFRTKMIARLYGVKCKGIGVKTDLIDLIKHLGIEEVYIIKNYFRIIKSESI